MHEEHSQGFDEHDRHKLRVVQQWREDTDLAVVALQCGHCGYSSTLHVRLDSVGFQGDDPLEGVIVSTEVL